MHDVHLISTIAAAFAVAWVLGLITQRIGLSPIVGYLLAGVVIGPHTPGFVGDPNVADQLAEVGVILLMFGVGLHFHLKDLAAVKAVAVPGAIVQSAVATGVATLLFLLFEWPLKSGLVLGMAMSVASTVVLLRVLMDREMLTTIHGHVAVGWLIVEDIFTVLLLVMVPLMAGVSAQPEDAVTEAVGGAPRGLWAIAWAMGKLAALVAIVLLAGSRVVPWVLAQVAKVKSRELFTLTVLVLSIAVAVGSEVVFGASVALGAFLAGMVVGQSPVSHQAAADVLPMRDAFAVVFFVSVGMVFDPSFVAHEPLMAGAGLAVVLIAKPLAALSIVAILGYSVRTALTVAIGLSQVGEFSFILSALARKHELLPEAGQHVLVAAAVVSITLNPLLFSRMDAIERWIERRPKLLKLLTMRSGRRAALLNEKAKRHIAGTEKPLAVIVGYGPVGRVVDAMLRDTGLETVIVDTNLDTIQSLTSRKRKAIYGDASLGEILSQAGMKQAVHLVVALPHSTNREAVVLAAREMNATAEITVRARYLAERDALRQAGATTIVFEEGEAGVALARQVLKSRNVDEAKIDKMVTALRQVWVLGE